jgi:dipeptidyl-peptidase-4
VKAHATPTAIALGLLLILVSCGHSWAQPTPAPRVYRDHVEAHWFANGSRFWYRNDLPQGRREFVLVDGEKGLRQPAFDHAKLADALGKKLARDVKSDELPVVSINYADGGKTVRLFGPKFSWRLDLSSYELTELTGAEAQPPRGATDVAPAGRAARRGGGLNALARNSSRSPDGKWEAFVRDHNLWIRDTKTQAELPLTTDGTDKDTYWRDPTRTRGVGMSFNAPAPAPTVGEVYWSPDSKHLVAMRTHTVPLRSVYLVESSPRDQEQPKLQSYPYFKPGDEIPVRKPHLFDVEGKKQIEVNDALFANPWDISEPRWESDSSRFTFLFNQRGHQVLRIIALDPQTGKTTPLVDEQSKTFIDYSGKFFDQYLDDTNEIIWMSERDGWNHLYLYDAKTGQVKNQITKGRWVVRGVERVEREKRQIWFRASGIYPDQDPYFVQYCRINFDGTGLTMLTDGNGYHSIQYSPDRRFIIDTYSRIDSAPATELRRAEDGKLACKLESGDASEYLAARHRFPEPFVTKGRDGKTDIYGVIWRPTDFDSSHKYPIIESIYAGPQDSFVPHSFGTRHQQQRLADRGFVVVQIDGMGTSNRSKAFHDVCWKNIGDAGFPDRILWIKAAAAKYPYMDLSRIGIYGTSAGGQNSLRGMLAHGDFYKVCVSDSGCHDNRMDKIWWNEQWMGWPVGPEYAEQSNVTQAHLLQGKLLLMWGEMDRNVDPSSTMQVVNALVRANKDFEMYYAPGAGHGVASTPYGRRRLEEFFVKNLIVSTSGTSGSTAMR